jgi:MFS family permease
LFRDRRLYRLATMHGIANLSVVIGNWTTTLFVRALHVSGGAAGLMGAMALTGGLITRPASGWLLHRRPDLVRATIAGGLVTGAAGILLIAAARSLPLAVVGATVLGLAAGIPFAPAMFGAGRVRPDAPGAAVGLVNMVGNAFVIAGTPLLGLAFSLPGSGRIGFAIVAGLWLVALAALPRAADFGS